MQKGARWAIEGFVFFSYNVQLNQTESPEVRKAVSVYMSADAPNLIPPAGALIKSYVTGSRGK